MSSRYVDEHAIASRPREGPGGPQISKHKQRNKALEVVFDPAAHKEYVTGFRKRKQQRRKQALKELEKRHREQRIEERAERRQAMKQQLGLGQEEEQDGEAGDEEQEEQQLVFHAGDLTSTVTVQPIATVSSDSEAGEGGDDVEDAEEDGEGAGTQWRHQHQQRVQQQQVSGEQPAHGKKLSKGALRIIEKTKLKVEGKRPQKQRGSKGGRGGKGGSKRGGRGGRR